MKEIRHNVAMWKKKNKIFNSVDFDSWPDAMNAVKAGELFTKSIIEDMKIDRDVTVEKYLGLRKRN